MRLRDELRELQSRLGMPILLITHDEADVAALRRRCRAHRRWPRRRRRLSNLDPEQSMKTSARNQLSGKVSVVASGAVNDEVELTLIAGQKIVAVVTRQSATSLGLVPGAEAFALVKASSVLVATDLGGARLSARNQLRGTVTKLQPGAVNAEVLIDVGGGQTLAAIITQESAARSGWRPAPRCSPCSRPRASSSACRASGRQPGEAGRYFIRRSRAAMSSAQASAARASMRR